MTSENYQAIATYLFIMGGIAFIAYIQGKNKSDSEIKKLKLKKEEEEKIFSANKDYIIEVLLTHAKKNKKVHFVMYDIEEGGEYLREINKIDLKHMHLIFEQEYGKNALLKWGQYNIKRLDLQKGIDRVMNEMPKSKSNSSVGFDD